MDTETTDTICAPASGSGRAGVAVFRVSGPNALGVLRRLTGRGEFEPRRVYRAEFSDPASGEVVDDGLALYFPAPNSFTGEDVAEIHVHGGRAVAAGMLSAVMASGGAVGGAAGGVRLAEPGEFTRRAFMNGKMDLTAAEALADLVDAETAAQRRQARRQLNGALGDLCLDWRARLVQAIAWFEAEIDFSDEDLPGGLAARTASEIDTIRSEIDSRLADRRTGERIRDGLRVAIVGPPNAGKSTLLNRLAGRDAAIVSGTAGTTRDVIEVHLDLGGYAVILADTAGIRAPGDAPGDAIEAEGARRAARTAEEADVRLVVLDGATWPEAPTGAAGAATAEDMVVLNKCDLMDSGLIDADPAGGALNPPPLPVSALTGHGMDRLAAELTRRVSRLSGVGEAPVVTRARHRAALEECAEALTRFDPHNSSELAAEDLRLAARALGRVIGEIDVEDILDVIFRDFCIGK